MLEVILEHLLSQWQFQNHQQNQPSKASRTRTKRITKEEEADEWLIKRNDCKITITLSLYTLSIVWYKKLRNTLLAPTQVERIT